MICTRIRVRAEKLFYITLLMLMIGVPNQGQAQSYATIYPQSVLKGDRPRLADRASRIWKYLIAAMPPEQAKLARRVTLRTPMPLPTDDLYEFKAGFIDGRATIILSTLGLKALEDAFLAFAWLHYNKFSYVPVELYHSMLKFRPVDNFPGGRYVDILTAIGVPKNALSDKRILDMSVRLRNEAFAFLLAHEFAHLWFRHRGYDEVTPAKAREDEMQSDRYALDLLGRTGTPPMGALLFFQMQIFRLVHRAEFPTKTAWEAYLAQSSTHPLSVDRIRAMANYMAGPLARRRRNERATWTFIGLGLGKIAEQLENGLAQKCLSRVAMRAPFSVLKPRRSGVSLAEMKVCK